MDKEVEEALESFVQDACESIGRLEIDTTFGYEHWKIGDDGNFRKVITPNTHINETTLSGYADVERRLLNDPTIGPQLNTLVGTSDYQIRIEPRNVILGLLYAQVADDGAVQFSREEFAATWSRLTSFFESTQFNWTLLAPILSLEETSLPIALSDSIALDKFSEAEVTRLVQAGLLQSLSPRFPFIFGKDAVGLRIVILIPKVVDQFARSSKSKPSHFGKLETSRGPFLLDEVLTALRLVDAGTVRSPGSVSNVAGYFIDSALQYTNRPYKTPAFGTYKPSASQKKEIVRVWCDLTSGVLENHPQIKASMHRYNLALDRYDAQDRLVDLVIAAEALFLNDSSQGELKFRLALRSSKFVKIPNSNQKDLFDLMKLAYDVRSNIVHNASISKDNLKKMPDRNVSKLADEVQRIMRMGIRKAIDLTNNGISIHRTGYWDSQLFRISSEIRSKK